MKGGASTGSFFTARTAVSVQAPKTEQGSLSDICDPFLRRTSIVVVEPVRPVSARAPVSRLRRARGGGKQTTSPSAGPSRALPPGFGAQEEGNWCIVVSLRTRNDTQIIRCGNQPPKLSMGAVSSTTAPSSRQRLVAVGNAHTLAKRRAGCVSELRSTSPAATTAVSISRRAPSSSGVWSSSTSSLPRRAFPQAAASPSPRPAPCLPSRPASPSGSHETRPTPPRLRRRSSQKPHHPAPPPPLTPRPHATPTRRRPRCGSWIAPSPCAPRRERAPCSATSRSPRSRCGDASSPSSRAPQLLMDLACWRRAAAAAPLGASGGQTDR